MLHLYKHPDFGFVLFFVFDIFNFHFGIFLKYNSIKQQNSPQINKPRTEKFIYGSSHRSRISLQEKNIQVSLS